MQKCKEREERVGSYQSVSVSALDAAGIRFTIPGPEPRTRHAGLGFLPALFCRMLR